MAKRVLVECSLSCSAIGSPQTVRREMEAFLQRTGADELMFDHAARLRCYEIVAALEPDPAAGPAPVAYPTRLDT